MGKPSRLEMLSFVRYVRSFIPGRVRVRHPALTKQALAHEARSRLEAMEGVRGVELNMETGSALILYDDKVLDKDTLIGKGIEWARWLDDAARKA